MVELLIVMAIIGILIGLLMPAISAVREAGRATQCRNNLKQIATAFQSHHERVGHFPTGGWGFKWVGDSDRGYGQKQPGGWAFNILPFLDDDNLHDLAKGLSGANKQAAMQEFIQQPVSVYHCPTRRSAVPRPAPGVTFNNDGLSAQPVAVGKLDYAACGGASKRSQAGPASMADADSGAFDFSYANTNEGIVFTRSTITMAHILDGKSTTLALGEKYQPPEHYDSGLYKGDDSGAYTGACSDTMRWYNFQPERDRSGWPGHGWEEGFGSAHPSAWNASFCDGSVRSLSYSIDLDTFKRLGNRADGDED